MIERKRIAPNASPIILARLAIAGVIISGGAVGLAAPASAYPCDALAISMTPKQSTACLEPADVAPPPEVAPDAVVTDPPIGASAEAVVAPAEVVAPADAVAPIGAAPEIAPPDAEADIPGELGRLDDGVLPEGQILDPALAPSPGDTPATPTIRVTP